MCSVRGVAAHDADRQGLGDVFRDGKKLGDGFERLAAIILIQAGDDDTFSIVRQLIDDVEKCHVEELCFVDADHLRICASDRISSGRATIVEGNFRSLCETI